MTGPALPDPRTFSLADIRAALATGWATFRFMPGASIAYALVFVTIGLAVLLALGRFGLSPMALPFAGGFMLLGPALLTGFFRLAVMRDANRKPPVAEAFRAFARAPAGLWLVSLLCAFLFLIWVTDAAILYSMMLGGEHLPYATAWLPERQGTLLAFEFWATLMGAVLAFIIFAISAFSVPLLHERRAGLVQAVHASVRAVLRNFLACLTWGLALAGATLSAIALLPLLAIVLPVLAYASFDLYKRVFPPASP